jgi:Helix-turn-helix domain
MDGVLERINSMSATKRYGRTPKSTARKPGKSPQIRLEEMTRRYARLVGAPAWTTYLIMFTYRNRKTNQCFPRYQKIADRRGVHRRTVIRHVNRLVAFGLIEKEFRFYDNYERGDRFGQRSNKYWFVAFSPGDVTPGVTAALPITSSSPNQIYTKDLAPKAPSAIEPCDHPWGHPMDYPHEGFWRCSLCGDPYKRN